MGPTDQPPVSPSPPASPLPDDEFVVLLTSHQGLLHAFLTSLLPGERCVDDVFQQTNLVLWQKRSEFQAGSNFRAWSLAVARWEVRAWLTRRQRGAWLTFSDELSETMLASFTDTSEGQTADNSTLDSLRQCLGKLKDKDRLLMLSHYQHDISNPADAAATAPDGHLHRGSVLRLDQGTVELAFRSQVRAVVRAPAHLVLDSPDQVTLHAGHAWFQVPAGAHGFRVITRDLEVTDLGTEFGVLAEPGRSDEVHVFAGRVLVRHRQDGDKTGIELTQNEALLASPRRTLDPVPVDAAAFTTRLQMHSKNLRWTFDDGNAQRFEATGSHPALADATATSGVPITSIPGPAGQALGFHPGQHLATRWQGIPGSLPRTVTAWIRVPADLTDEALPSNIVFWGQEGSDLAMSKWRVGLNPERLGEGGVKGALRTEFGLGWVIGSTDLRDGRWHHIASVYQGGNGRDNTARILLYVDGVLETQSAGQHQLIDTQSGAPLNLAGKGGRIDLDDVQVFESALDASTIAELWRAHAADGK